VATCGVWEALRVSCYRFSLARCILIRISVTTSDMGDGLVAVSECRSANSMMFT
jgi:hypothetical protein